MSEVHQGACFCGTVRIELTGDPETMGYCHCTSCRQWSGDPVHAYTIWQRDNVVVRAGAKSLATFQSSPDSLSHRQYCSKCGGHVMISHPELGIYDVFSGVSPGLKFVPTMHLNYAEAVLPMSDGLPKYKDFPFEFGGLRGSGVLMDE
ncbi:MAG: GFA family protein [Proteobacteria bacterium]|nr:GFA family protein [Pseudomonadota bacterium]